MLQGRNYIPVIIQFLYQPFDSAIKLKKNLFAGHVSKVCLKNKLVIWFRPQWILRKFFITVGHQGAMCHSLQLKIVKHWEDNDNDDDNDEGDVCATYLIDEPLFVPICLLSYSINSSSRAAAFSESIQNSFFCGDISGLLWWYCDYCTHLFSQWWDEPEHWWCLHSGPQECVDSYLKVSTLEQARVWFWKAFTWSNIHFNLCFCIDVTKNATYDLTLTMLTGQNWFLFGSEGYFGCKASIMTVRLHY